MSTHPFEGSPSVPQGNMFALFFASPAMLSARAFNCRSFSPLHIKKKSVNTASSRRSSRMILSPFLSNIDSTSKCASSNPSSFHLRNIYQGQILARYRSLFQVFLGLTAIIWLIRIRQPFHSFVKLMARIVDEGLSLLAGNLDESTV